MSSSWDWPFIYYAGTVWLRMDEESLWRTTPRKLFALIKVHLDILKATNGGGEASKGKNSKSQVPIKYIDQIDW